MMKRYFMEEANVKPGVISEELRNALGISKKSLPIWIHRMRILGYPPGWLKKADMTNTTIDFINGDDDREEGQVDSIEKKTYNTDSFHEYPGFNAPVPNGVRDDYENLGMPPMQGFQQLNYAKQTVLALQPVPHRARFTDVKDKKDVDEESDSSGELSDSDKKAEHSVVVLNTSVESGSAPAIDSIISLSSDEENDVSISSDSNEIITLDVEKRVLCSTIDESSSVLLSPVPSKSISNTVFKEPDEAIRSKTEERPTETANDSLSENKSTCISTDGSTIVTQIEPTHFTNSADSIVGDNGSKKDEKRTKDNQEPQGDQLDEIDVNQNVDHKNTCQVEEESASRMTLVSMGVSVPASLNGEKPPLENFAVGMGDLVYFENLPTSTGMFDKMRKVIKKVRKKLSSSSTKSNVSITASSKSSTSHPDQHAE